MQKFNQLKDYLLELSFLALLIRIIIFGAGIGDSIAIVSLVISMAYSKWLAKNKLEQYEELKSMIQDLNKSYDDKFSDLYTKVNLHNMDRGIKKVTADGLSEQPKRRFF